MKPKREPAFATEAEMCAAFIAGLPEGWTAYAETAGFDILLAGPGGVQIGVEAKLRLNGTVIRQIVEGGVYSVSRPGPNYRAVLVPPECNTELAAVCDYVGVTVMTIYRYSTSRDGTPIWRPHPELPSRSDRWVDSQWHEMLPQQRCPLPEYIPDVAAGDSAPLQLTAWKIGALKLAVLLANRGFLTRPDFKRVGIDHRRWIARGAEWLTATPEGWRPGKHLPDFKAQHPRVWAEIEADPEKWMPAAPEQGSLVA